MNKHAGAMAALVGSDIWQAPLFDSVYKAFEVGVDAASIAVGDDCAWLSWYIYENDCGRGGMEASKGTGYKLRKVDTVAKLVALMEYQKPCAK